MPPGSKALIEMNFHVITLFPEMIEGLCAQGVLGRAIKQDAVSLRCWNPRDFAHDKHRTVDDRPYGGGPGMLMKVQPLSDAILAARAAARPGAKVIYLSPQGEVLQQARLVDTAAADQDLILIAGRYEGIDERIIAAQVDAEWSIGDYVLSGGELAAGVVIDALTRLLPGVLGDDASAQQDSFMNGLLDCPHYTRPEAIDSQAVPEVLLGGDHSAIARWRLKQSLGRTWLRRPDLLNAMQLDAEQKKLLAEFQQEQAQQ